MGEPARRTSSGHTLRLVPADGVIGDQPDRLAVDSILLPAERQSVAVGRHWVVRTAAVRGATGMANQVLELLSSELLANAVLHGPSAGGVGVQLLVDDERTRVSVSDGNPASPVVMQADPSALNGRGMAIVEAMSSRWGVDTHEDGGKTVWFELDLDDF